jgi:hypothetical protein
MATDYQWLFVLQYQVQYHLPKSTKNRFYNDKARYRVTLGLTYNFNGGKRVNVKQTSSQQSYSEMEVSK